MITPADILRGRILIVDDQPANVQLLEQTLRGAGYLSVSSTLDSAGVCQLHLLNHYDLILLDLQMPGMDGFQVMEGLKEVEAGDYLPVLVVTAQPAHKLRALRAGARDFVSKPFDLAEVLLRVHNLLEVRLLYRETKTLYQRILAEQQVSARLLLGALPQDVAERVKGHPEGAPEGSAGLVTGSWAELTVLFSDLIEFNRFAEGASAEVLVGVLDDLASRLDGPPARARRDLVGDAYLAALGLPDALVERTIGATHKALDLVAAIDRFNAHGRYQLKVRIGLDAGPVGASGTGARETHHDL